MLFMKTVAYIYILKKTTIFFIVSLCGPHFILMEQSALFVFPRLSVSNLA